MPPSASTLCCFHVELAGQWCSDHQLRPNLDQWFPFLKIKVEDERTDQFGSISSSESKNFSLNGHMYRRTLVLCPESNQHRSSSFLPPNLKISCKAEFRGQKLEKQYHPFDRWSKISDMSWVSETYETARLQSLHLRTVQLHQCANRVCIRQAEGKWSEPTGFQDWKKVSNSLSSYMIRDFRKIVELVTAKLRIIDKKTILNLWRHVIRHLFEYLIFKPLWKTIIIDFLKPFMSFEYYH